MLLTFSIRYLEKVSSNYVYQKMFVTADQSILPLSTSKGAECGRFPLEKSGSKRNLVCGTHSYVWDAVRKKIIGHV